MRLALEEAKKCKATPTAFCVGCIITTIPTLLFPKGEILSTGYSRELEGNTHAEECAISKFLTTLSILSSPSSSATVEELDQEIQSKLTALKSARIYTTMEPCSLRLSGNTPCVDRVIELEFNSVYMGVEEPGDFVICEGVRKLREKGIEVFVVVQDGLREDCLREARRGH